MSHLTVSEIYSTAKELTTLKTVITARGWVRVHRSGDAGKLQFIWFTDGSTIKKLQAVYHGECDKIDYLASVEITGVLIE
jgi:aspartyl/asparaginyl-tRNA synthetase